MLGMTLTKLFFPALSIVGLLFCAACGGTENDQEDSSASLQNTGRGPVGSCTINLCNGLKQPGEMACYFGVCICVAGDKQVQCTSGNDQCDECAPIPLKPFTRR